MRDLILLFLLLCAVWEIARRLLARVPAHELHQRLPYWPAPYRRFRHKGDHHEVTADWHERYTKPWPFLAAKSAAQIDAMRMSLIRKSENPLTPVSRHERIFLVALDRHADVRSHADLMQDAHPRDFGLAGMDQVQFLRRHCGCGCHLMWVLDRSKVAAKIAHDPIEHTPLRACDDHKSHAGDPSRFHAIVLADEAARQAQARQAADAAAEASKTKEGTT